uniref:NADH dehydrogenase subunit 6 n=1 Tax=Exallonyx sp. ZJUH_2016014 TaxID=2491158 RepID=A0A3S8V0R6_9HYME|nr:NADH dehydrogenase subunit 6 [Exallonyx sp. ZJUH_2016014]
MNLYLNMKLYTMWLIMLLSFMNILILLPINKKYYSPILMTTLLLMFTFVSILNISILSSSYMYSFLMFLMFIGGILILFLYFNSFIMNSKNFLIKKFLLYSSMKMYLLTLLNLLILSNWMIYFISMNNFIEISTMYINMKLNSMILMNDSTIKYMYLYPYNMYTIFIIIYLFFTLVTVMKICFFKNFN